MNFDLPGQQNCYTSRPRCQLNAAGDSSWTRLGGKRTARRKRTLEEIVEDADGRVLKPSENEMAGFDPGVKLIQLVNKSRREPDANQTSGLHLIMPELRAV